MNRRTTTCLVALLLTSCHGIKEIEQVIEDEVKAVERETARLSHELPDFLNVLTGHDQSCGEYKQEDLREPVRISPIDGVLETQLVVAIKERCVPVFHHLEGWKMVKKKLRTYGFPKDHSKPLTAEMVTSDLRHQNIVWSAPGPTLVLDKASAPGVNDGSNLKFTLFNAMPVQDDPHACDEISSVIPPILPFTPDTEPNCYHGNNSTNFHLHGSHVSPQPHQDYVGLELLPFGAERPEQGTHARGSVAVGEYSYDIDRIRYTQAEGTHWYHAHKHGATALQVLNGMVGALEIRGEFDQQLQDLYADQGGLTERLMVVQQLEDRQSQLGNELLAPPEPVVNGQANPIVRMRPGEVQRWRFVGATMQDSARIDIGFAKGPGGDTPSVRQIAMDGVQFAPENYDCQPIMHGPDCDAGTDDDSFKEANTLRLAPGTRIDLLVQAPSTPGRFNLTFDSAGHKPEHAAGQLAERIEARIKHDGEKLMRPALITLVVEGDPVDAALPTVQQFPKLPAFLSDIEGPFRKRDFNYQMEKVASLGKAKFFINGEQYDPGCVNETLTLDEPEEWMLTNDSPFIAHPFHIHTNPFQLVQETTWSLTGGEQVISYNAPYIWRDTLPIPTGGKPGKGLVAKDLGRAKVRYVAREFTGEFVNHCHILGHEDLGMMQNVQAVCPNGDYGLPTDDLSPECKEGNYATAGRSCDADDKPSGGH